MTKSVEAASNLPMPLMLLPFLGSGRIPAGSLPAGMRRSAVIGVIGYAWSMWLYNRRAVG
ncbi:MAG: hypothetical protein WBJ62_07980 [Coriobacteriia bacterium]